MNEWSEDSSSPNVMPYAAREIHDPERDFD
jgi:hypothetical protein